MKAGILFLYIVGKNIIKLVFTLLLEEYDELIITLLTAVISTNCTEIECYLPPDWSSWKSLRLPSDARRRRIRKTTRIFDHIKSFEGHVHPSDMQNHAFRHY